MSGKESMDAGPGHLNEHHGRDYTSAGHLHTNIAQGPYHGAQKPLVERFEIDYTRAAVQLKAEHMKENAALKAEEIQMKADLTAEHAMTAGKTGFFAKLMHCEDPIKRGEEKHLKAEILRAKESTRAEHAYEIAELEAKKVREYPAANPGSSE